jgi:glycosyltransferase involved in cell wall biosynthesis
MKLFDCPGVEVSLPRLAYIGQVPVCNISAGPALLYRLLETYPPDRLLVAESAENQPSPAHQLRAVSHLSFPLLRGRLLNSRLNRLYGSWVYFRAARRARPLLPALRAFGAEAILGIAHGYAWRTAAAAARSLGVPLHLVVHDHWRECCNVLPWFDRRAEKDFAATYRAAASRLTVSPDMEACYRSRYGAAGTVVYPCRAASALRLAQPPFRTPTPGAFVFAYAGNAEAVDQRRTLIDFAHAAAPLGVRLRIYQGLSLDTLRAEGLVTDNVEIAAFRPVNELYGDLVASVDALYLPMSFAPESRANVELCFPSKLADYTAVGLPILVRAPDYGTATHWARAHPEAAMLVDSADPEPLAGAIARIARDAPCRHALARGALEAGERQFSHAAVFTVFCSCLRRA